MGSVRRRIVRGMGMNQEEEGIRCSVFAPRSS